ncbi:MAG: flavodoxin [Eubacteriales bacterium]|nr:flavodoxin [Eubacteriales bacterium]
MKSAVIYYSRSGMTKTIAEKIKDVFHSDLFFVEPEKAYGSYLSAVLRNGKEKISRKTAKVATPAADFSPYDVIFVGFPVWYGTMPDFMQEYIRKCDIRGKKVIPFATAGANGRDSSLETVKSLFTGCTVSDYFYTTKPKGSEADVWLKELTGKLK